jgi:apolipoprotein N-acyltransferase
VGAALHAATTPWLVETLVRFSGHALPVCVLLALAVWCWEGGRVALLAWAMWRTATLGRDALLLAPFAWVAIEWAYPMLFPSQLGALLGDVPLLVQIADLGGVGLVSLLTMAVLAASVDVLRAVRGRATASRLRLFVTAGALAASLGYGQSRMVQVDAAAAAAPQLRVGVVQPNSQRPATESPDALLAREIALSRDLLAAEQPALLVWPESALPGALDARVTRVSKLGLQVPLIAGTLALRTDHPRGGLTNAVVLLDGRGHVRGRYDKIRLVPFSERVPFVEHWPALQRFAPRAGGFTPGAQVRPLMLGATRIAATVCYEDLFADLVREQVLAFDPHVLVNVTNDAWFGDSTAAGLHMALARLRAVEQRRALVRATQTGMTVIVDPVGRTVARAPSARVATLVHEVPLLHGRTLYATLGDWPAWLGALVSVLLLFARRGSLRRGLPAFGQRG